MRLSPLSPAALLASASLLAGCDRLAPSQPPPPASPPAAAAPSSSRPEGPRPEGPLLAPSPADLAALADARDLDGLLAYVAAPDLASRRRVAWALARLHDPSALDALLSFLRADDAELRFAASFAIGALEGDAPPRAVEALIAAYAVEPPTSDLAADWVGPDAPPLVAPTVRAMMLWALARARDPRAIPALVRGLEEDTESRVAACRGVADARAPEPRALEPLLTSAIARASSDPSPRVREACLAGLARAGVPDASAPSAERAAVAALLGRASDEPSVEQRVQAARLLGRLPSTDASYTALRGALADSSPRVVVSALLALGRVAPWASGADPGVLGAVFDRALPATGGAPTPRDVAILLTLLEVARPFARTDAVYRAASAWQARLEGLAGGGLARAWLVCRAAQLVDLGRGWPSRVERCAEDALDDDTRRALAAEVIQAGQGADPQRRTYLEHLLRDGGPRAREAALAATSSLSPDAALALLRRGLDDPDLGVTLAALEALEARAPSARRARDAATMASILGGAGAGEVEPLFPSLQPALVEVGRRLLASDSLEARVTLSSSVAALADPASPGGSPFAPLLEPLARHPSRGVRDAARAALEALHADVALDAIDAVPDPIGPGELTALPRRLILETSAGTIAVELDRERAPVSVARLARLAERGFYDGLTFHRVIPGFVAQGGDPRGDGYGGAPGLWLRDEPSPLAYERGVVGIALAGPDTGGSQLFVTLGPQHHLDARYTVIGRVRELDTLDALVVGSRIERARLDP